jgi:hypothetical protein
MTILQLLTLNKEIQIDESFGVSLDAQIQDVRELGEVKSSSSKPLFIRSTEEINELFGFLFNINASTLQFDTNIKQECRLVRDGQLLADGYFQITNIDYLSKHEYIYEITVFDEQTDFFTAIQENELTDLDFSQYDHTYDLADIENSWDNDCDTLPYIYLLNNSQESSYWLEVVDYRPAFYVKWLVDYIFTSYGFKYDSDFFESDLFKELVIPYSSNDGLPTISDAEVENRKFVLEGASGCNDEFIGVTNFMPSLVANEPQAQLPSIIREIYTLPANNQTSGDTNLIDEGSCSPSNFGEITYYTPIRNGADNINFDIPVKLEITNNTAHDLEPSPTPSNVLSRSHAWFYLELRKRKPAATNATTLDTNMTGGRLIQSNLSELINTVIVPIALFDVDAGMTENINTNIIGQFQNVEVEQGAEYYITVQVSKFLLSRVSNPEFKENVDYAIRIGGGAKVFNSPIKVELNEGSILNVNEFLPQNFKQKDFLRSLTKMFNLKWQPIGDKTIQVEPRDEFYKKGNIIDLRENDEFFVTKKPSQYKAVNELQSKEIVFRYKDDSDSSDKQEMLERRLQKDYLDSFKEYYGQQRILFENENLRGERVIEPDFSPTIPAYSTAVNNGRRYICSLIDARNPKCNYRILFVNRLTQTGRNVINLNKATKVYNTATPDAGENFETVYLDRLVIGTHYRSDPFEPTFDLNYGRVRQSLFPTKGTDNNLFNTYWINEISSINTSQMVVAHFYISNFEFNKLRLNDVLYFEKTEWSKYFIINKIIEYNAKSGEAKMELITYDPTQNFPRFSRPIFEPIGDLPIDDFDTGINTGLPSDSINDEFGIVNGVNNEGQGYHVINGNNNVVGKNSVVSGDNNTVGEKVFAFGNNNDIVEKQNVLILGDGYTDADVEDGTIITQKLIVGGVDLSVPTFKAGEVMQSGTSDPTFITQVDTIGLVSFTRFSAGIYDLLFPTDFFSGKTLNCMVANNEGSVITTIAKRTNSIVRVTTVNTSGTLVENALDEASIIIEVY